MGDTTKIEWCDATFNPWWGCTRISPACDHCYAAALSKRYGHDVWDNGQRRTFGEKHWSEPLKWARAMPEKLGRRPRVFCASMADVFDNDAPAGERERLWKLIYATPELDWLLLTKRIGNVRSMLPVLPSNVWLGATIANQEEASRDIPKLMAAEATVRFLSCEPLLGRVDLCEPLGIWWNSTTHAFMRSRAPGLQWVIAGGESGHQARPGHPDWFRSLRDQCEAARVPFLFKQWGEWHPGSERHGRHACVDMAGRVAEPCTRDKFPPGAESADGWTILARVGKKAAGRELDGRTHDGFPNA